MAITEQISCDVCGKQKGSVNHWWMALAEHGSFLLHPWDDNSFGQKGMKHLCGQGCVIKAVNEYLSGGK